MLAEFVSLRNYLDGFGLSLGALGLAQRALAARGWRHLALAGAAAALFLLGALAKKLYVTTPFVLIGLMFLWHRRWAASAIPRLPSYVLYYRWLIGSLTPTFDVERRQ